MKKALKILFFALAAVAVYYFTWTPSTEGISEKARIAVERSEACTHPNNDFTHVIHFPKEWKKDYTGAVGKYPQTCMNTVSAFYSPEANWAQCIYFVNHLKKLGFKETDSPKPGDVVVFFDRNHEAHHTGLYVGKSLFGPLMNHSDGGRKPYDYQKHMPVKLFMLVRKKYVDYKYYTYVG